LSSSEVICSISMRCRSCGVSTIFCWSWWVSLRDDIPKSGLGSGITAKTVPKLDYTCKYSEEKGYGLKREPFSQIEAPYIGVVDQFLGCAAAKDLTV